MNTFVAGTAVLSLAGLGVVFAANSSPPATQRHGMMGGMGHGMMSEENLALILERHPEADTDEDGILSEDEARAFIGSRHGPAGARGMKGRRHRGAMGQVNFLLEHLTKLDAETAPADFDLQRHPQADIDGDGELSDVEWIAFAEISRARMHARLLALVPEADIDDDGWLNEEELAALRIEQSANLREHVLANNPDADTDGDGALSEAELEAFMAERAQERRAMMLKDHPEADTDGDGSLSQEEARAFRGSRQGGFQGAGCPFGAGCPAKWHGGWDGDKDKRHGHGNKHGNGS